MTEVKATTLEKFLWGAEPTFFEPFADKNLETSPLYSIVTAFQKNLNAAIMVGSIPFTLANAAIHQQTWQSVFTAESIRGLQSVNPGESPDRVAASARAREILRAQFPDEKYTQEHAKRTVAFVEEVTSEGDAAEATVELLRQVLVVIWGAFEVLVNDVVVESLNRAPQLAERLKQAQRYKAANISVEKLAQHNFDLSKKMGAVIFEDQRLDTIKLIEEVCELLFDAEALSKSLKNQELWNLAQKRNLIVHRRGMVDSQYLSKTPYTVALGSALVSSGKEVDMFLRVVRDVGLELVQTANETLTSVIGK